MRRHSVLALSAVLVGSSLALGVPAASAADAVGPTIVVVAPDDDAVRAAVTFPVGWRLEASAETARRQVDALADDERCEVSTRRSEFADLETDVDDFVVSLSPGSGFTFSARAPVSLPAGPAERVDFADEAGARWSVYVVPDAGHMHELWCRGDVLPDDRWLPIAETFQLEPAAELTSSAFDPVARRPDAGLAISFPEPWQVRGSSTDLGLLYATNETAVCAVSDYTSLAADHGWTTVEAMHDEYVATAGERSDITVEETSYLDLAAGQTGFAELVFDDGTRAVRYSFRDPARGTLVALFCVGDPVPEDRYLSLAESLTWLAATEA
jgi:hypothetical protein